MKTLGIVLVVWSLLVPAVHAAPTPTTTEVVTTSQVQTQQDIAGKAKVFSKKVLAHIENFRVRQLGYFTALKDAHKDVIAETTIKDITTIMTPTTPTTSPATEKSEVENEESHEQTMRYMKYGYAWAGEQFFSRKALYYVVILLLALCIVRFIGGRFFS